MPFPEAAIHARFDMGLEATWSLVDIPSDARDAAQAAARREGVSVGEWLTRRILKRFSELNSREQEQSFVALGNQSTVRRAPGRQFASLCFRHAGAASDEDNSIEFVTNALPSGVTVPGSAFRQRDINVYQAQNPTVTRANGIYRRVGDTFYADFGNQFPDVNLLKGSFSSADQLISVEQLEPAAGPCRRR